MEIPELLAPAGNFSTAIYAFRAGADAVYLGLKEFSARNAAENFSLEDLRCLRTAADENQAKIYLAVNTVIKQSEYSRVLTLIGESIDAGIDAVIVQDLGLASGIRDNFPTLPIHASTQMALHNTNGLHFAKTMGMKRVVLSRELRISEIENLALEAKILELELEVFIHGAYCYGFSGLCLASSTLTSRSGNRGECAQICRGYFDSGKDKGYYFSANDIETTNLIPRLAGAPVHSLKIEGRLKTEAYVFHTVRHYRKILDKLVTTDEIKSKHDEDSVPDLEKSLIEFSRSNNTGSLLPPSPGQNQVNVDYPGPRGIPGVQFGVPTGDLFSAHALRSLHIRDRLSWFPSGIPSEPVHFLVQKTKGTEVLLSHLADGPTPSEGTVLNLTREAESHLKMLSSASWKPKATELQVSAEITAHSLVLKTVSGQILSTLLLSPQEARSKNSFQPKLAALLAENDQGRSLLALTGVTNQSEFADDSIFFPPAALKKWKNEAYRFLSENFPKVAVPKPVSPPTVLRPLPPRDRIRFLEFPFVIEANSFDPKSWTCIDGIRYLSLSPVLFDSTSYLERIETALTAAGPVRIGLNNAGHLDWASKFPVLDNVSFFLDYGIYLANWSTYSALKKIVPMLDGAYLWVEADDKTVGDLKKNAPDGLNTTSGCLPIFISRICHKRLINGNECPDHCDKKWDQNIVQNKRQFRIIVNDCLSYVFPFPYTSGPKR